MESIYNFNELLQFYKNKKKEIVENFDPQYFISFVKDDQICEKSLFDNNNNNLNSIGYSCKNCKKLSEVFYDYFTNPENDNKYNDNIIIPFKDLSEINYNIEIKKEDYVESFYEIQSELGKTKFYKKLEEISLKKYCGLQSDPGKTTLIAYNVWLNSVLINWILEITFESLEIPKHVPELLSAFECSENGYKVLKKNYEPLLFKSSLNEEEVVGILYQIASIWETLQFKYFIHGSITIDKLHYRDDSVRYTSIKGNKIYSPITLVIDGFNFSSIYISENLRIIPNNRGRNVDLDLSINKFKPIIQTNKDINDAERDSVKQRSAERGSVKQRSAERDSAERYSAERDSAERDSAERNSAERNNVERDSAKRNSAKRDKNDNDNILLYKTQMGAEYFFNVMRYSGYPLFGGSYDIYSIFTSLMSWCMFKNVVNNNIKLKNIWSEMFYDTVNLPVPYEKNIKCSFKIGNLLGNKYLYCDSISRLMMLLQKYYPLE